MTTISASMVKDLREKTGAGMMDCKKALAESGGDMEAALDYLRKRGQAIADKKSSRTASEGLIFWHVKEDGSAASLFELKCETDFVAKNDAFIKLGNDLVRYVSEGAPGAEEGPEAFGAAPSPSDSSKTVQDTIRQTVAVVGENMGIGGMFRAVSSGANHRFHCYIHPPGKLGVLVEVKAGKAETLDNPAVAELCQDLAMHIAWAAPEYMTRDEVPQARLDREADIYKAQAENEGKSPEVAEKMIKGRMGKFYAQVCLIEQAFVKNSDETIDQLIKRVGKELGDEITLVRYARLKVGD